MKQGTSSMAWNRPTKAISSLELNKNLDPETYSSYSTSDNLSTKSASSGVWNSTKEALKGVWTTKQILPKNAEKEFVIRTTLRELIVYITFLTVVSLISLSTMNPTMYYQTKLLSELFLDKPYRETGSFRTSTTMDQFWKFAEEVLIDGLYWDRWYNKNKTDSEVSILYENYLITSPHLRQLKVRNDSCEIHKNFRKAIHTCYSSYADYLEEREELKNGTGFEWTEIESFAKNAIWGQIATYSGDGGYIVDLGLNKTAARQIIVDLKNNLWIDRGTRVVFVDFTTYNPNINLFVVSKLIAEFPATGGMITSWQFRTLKLFQNDSQTTISQIIFAIFMAFIVYYTIEELIEIKTLGLGNYLNDSFWNSLDILTIILGALLVFYSFYKNQVINKIFSQAVADEGTRHLSNSSSVALRMETYQFDTLGFWAMQFNNMLALLTFIVWVKVFKYISFNKTMSQLSSTLSRCSKDIAGFGVMFFIVFFAFAQLGYLLFGNQVKDYSSFGSSVFTLLRLILGDFNFNDLEAANRVLGPIFFLSYIFFVFFVLMNMFLAIINDTYAEVKNELHDSKDEFPIMDYFKSHYQNLLTKLGKQRDQIEGIQQVLRADKNRKLDFEYVRDELKKRNLTNPEIEMLFAKYDLDCNRELDEEELKQMLDDLEGKKQQLNKEIAREQKRPASAMKGHSLMNPEDGIKLMRRVDRMEHVLSIISTKIDAAIECNIIPQKSTSQEDETK